MVTLSFGNASCRSIDLSGCDARGRSLEDGVGSPDRAQFKSPAFLLIVVVINKYKSEVKSVQSAPTDCTVKGVLF